MLLGSEAFPKQAPFLQLRLGWALISGTPPLNAALTDS